MNANVIGAGDEEAVKKPLTFSPKYRSEQELGSQNNRRLMKHWVKDL